MVDVLRRDKKVGRPRSLRGDHVRADIGHPTMEFLSEWSYAIQNS
jgi:hypothetical protein